ncbi:MAG: histidine kinase [Coriobacteriia bacterium]|nr:histidine kinase [Coriobacteriia bacterium]MCL2750905.1 histidine kinase [Coriobacteriia bacterium]
MKRSLSLVEIVVIIAVAVLFAVAVIALLSNAHPVVVAFCTVAALSLIMLMLRLNLSPDRLRARQSERTLKLAAQTLPFMQKGLSIESAQEVCKLLLPATEASAVSITDKEIILGYFGREMKSHRIGSPITTEATKRTIAEGRVQIARSHEEIGRSKTFKLLQAAICVPLFQHEEVVGVLKFYYRNAQQINANQLAMAEGLGGLLDMQLRLAELEHQRELAAKMNLKALQAQINPHFLYNTINTIASLIRTNPQHARILLREFAVFYRQTLEGSMEETTLDWEINQTLRYLGFEKARFGSDQIIVGVEVDEELLNIDVPAFIIQPLVENAVAHARRVDEPLHVYIRGSITGQRVVIIVEDDGIGMPESTQMMALKVSDPERTGVALKNVAERLEGFFGKNAGLEVQSEVNVGTRIILNLGLWDSCKVVKDDKSDNSR